MTVVTVIISVDLNCWHSATTIKWAVCQLKMCFKINSIVYDDKKCTVTVSGLFDPHSFVHQLRCLAGSVIKNVIIEPPPPPPTPPCRPCPGQWCWCYVVCQAPHQGGCGCGGGGGGCGCSRGCGQFRPWPPACGSSPCSGCSRK